MVIKYDWLALGLQMIISYLQYSVILRYVLVQCFFVFLIAELLTRQVDFKVLRERIATRIFLNTGRSLEVTGFNFLGKL